ncbi:hypothetical protein COY23_00160 [bacterium (Candidatus Torokbacteria) CG_4_10_14_0_2_um_filter_35_8]|uniref:TGS domain-containing protein n=1 Tax=Candidatus Sherwoodlollariibacterium unditelluris TaxID=1974757 RepID=A0A2G9YK54_9BACT|nr:MAG: hypothetical protein COX41_04620 [Candidatus Omnitrophica bacterium CG23_combo_of_CG06-09_8_20_14_all_41_10]PIZ58906.1 MAG: hypothetical protein COY23_00160 [bacterium (Candidatus Torokbacteria) CG_4_10_14_0_2_um_filter_35_8]
MTIQKKLPKITYKKLSEKIKKNSPNVDLRVVKRAYLFSQKAHKGQKRKSGEEYLQHPLHTAFTLTELNLDTETIIAALLHDTLEDTSYTLSDIEKYFGRKVAKIVEGVSKLGQIKLRKDTKEYLAENLRKMFVAMAEDIRVILVRLADRKHNLQTLYALPRDKQIRIARESLEVYAPIAERLGMGEIKGRIEDLAFHYLYPKKFKSLEKRVRKFYKGKEKHTIIAKKKLKKLLKNSDVSFVDIHSRAKHTYSLHQKLQRYNDDIGQIYDIVALRVIVSDIASCYKALGIIHQYWKPLTGRIKDYIANPKPNGYQSLHTTVFCDDGKIIEIQIRTEKMHEEAEYGVAAHWYYSERDKKSDPLNLKKFSWVRDLAKWQQKNSNKDPGEFLKDLRTTFFEKHIFVFTPKGDPISLPEGATPIDFAFKVHTELGFQCQIAKVNGKIVRLNTKLASGDLVEIMTLKNKSPSQDWLKFVKTHQARSKIRAWFRKKNGR